MVYSDIIKSTKLNLYLRSLSEQDCTDRYLSWLQNPQINQYLETRLTEQSLETVKAFVNTINDSEHSYLFGIFYNNMHIGNIKLGPIHPVYHFADISYFIGETSEHGKGIATEAVRLVCDFGFKTKELHRISAGGYATNLATKRVLEKNGFVLEGIYREKVYINGNYIDAFWYAKLNKKNYNESIL